jgi:hypothetical protein
MNKELLNKNCVFGERLFLNFIDLLVDIQLPRKYKNAVKQNFDFGYFVIYCCGGNYALASTCN